MNLFQNSLYKLSGDKSIDEIQKWIKWRNEEVSVHVTKILLSQLKMWGFDKNSKNLVHDTGRFFSIEGINVKTDYCGIYNEWKQPIINQPEVGYLGILAKEIDGVLHFLMQAKVEPGNINNIQISPTLQATKSNYNQAHKGKSPLYLDYFRQVKPENIILDQLQSEQGARFLRKRNRNIIIKVDEEIPVYDDFCWMTIGQIKELILQDNAVNMDTRTVLSGLIWSELLVQENTSEDILNSLSENSVSDFAVDMMFSALSNSGIYSINNLLSWLSQLKSFYSLSVDKIPLKDVDEWIIGEEEITRSDNRFFKVIAVDISISSREVKQWSQPLIEPMHEGICAFIVKKINNIYHFLVQAKLECGNFDIVELAPTVQCLTGGYTGVSKVPLFLNYVLRASKEQIIFDVWQSEEGGRFYKEQNRNMLVVAGDDFDENVPENFTWMTLGQLQQFQKFNNYLNIQTRSLLSMIPFK